MKIGILGGGQLAMMMIEKSLKHDIDFIVLDPSHKPPASRYVNCIKSEFEDKKALDKLASECNVVTIDFENVPSDSLKYICLLYTSPSPRDRTRSRMPSSA